MYNPSNFLGALHSREGSKGCVMVRGAVGMFLLLFFEVRFVGFGWLFLV